MKLALNENLKVLALDETEKINGGSDPQDVYDAICFAALCGCGGVALGAFVAFSAYEIWESCH